MELCLNAIINNGKLNNLGTTMNKNKHVCTIFIKQMKMLRSLKENNQKNRFTENNNNEIGMQNGRRKCNILR